MTDCLVIGAGIIGISCGLELLRRGKSVVILDENLPGSMTSSGNAGGLGITEVMPIGSPGVIKQVPKWLMDPYGPLSIKISHLPAMLPWFWRFHRESSKTRMIANSKALSNLLAASLDDTKELLKRSGISGMLTEEGALTVYPSEQSMRENSLEWQVKQDNGVNALKVDRLAIHDLEPDLHHVECGWFTPQWCNVTDPFLLTTRLAERFQSNGGRLYQTHALSFKRGHDKISAVVANDGNEYPANQYVVAAGIWSKSLCRQLGENVLLESERGYNTTLPNPGLEIGREIIFGEEKFVASTIGSSLRIGGAAEFAGIDTPPNFKRSDRLLAIANRYLPGLNCEFRENWMGHRPSTPDSLPVIGHSGKVTNLMYAFGHGHLGLTMAATTAKIIGNLSRGEASPVDLEPCRINRFN